MPTSLPAGTYSEDLTHNLGGNIDDYVVDLQCKVSGWASTTLTDQGLGEEFYYSDLTTRSITISGPKSALDRQVAIRVRIWVYR
jgi:hypothetical protein